MINDDVDWATPELLKEKVILVDCDGVLLDWIHCFDLWMHNNGYPVKDSSAYKVGDRYGLKNARQMIEWFNQSAMMGFLPPFRDAIHYVQKLHRKHGYVFHCITSMTDNVYAQKLRQMNLESLFGKTIFEKYVFLPCGSDKTEALREYKNTNCYWIEDKISNADDGLSVGLDSLLIAHDHNAGYKGGCVRVDSWKDVYNIIVGN